MSKQAGASPRCYRIRVTYPTSISNINEQKNQFTNAYIKHLDSDEFGGRFSQCSGPITSTVFQINTEGRSEGFGFVIKNNVGASEAIETRHDGRRNGDGRPIASAQKED